MKYRFHLVVALIVMQLLVVAAAHAAPGGALSSGAGSPGGGGTAVVNEARTGSGNPGVLNGSGIDRSRSRTCPVTITKIRPLTKTFGYVCNGNRDGLVLILPTTLSISGRTPGDPHRPRPAGRSP